jgi:hypothetical protein
MRNGMIGIEIIEIGIGNNRSRIEIRKGIIGIGIGTIRV